MNTAYWIGDKLVMTERIGEQDTKLVITKFTKVHPCQDGFCYWCACDGKAFALQPESIKDSCIATVENALRLLVPGKYRSTYVIWQPRANLDATWCRWAKKWSKRTKEDAA